MTEIEQLENDIRFGAEVQQFLTSNIGRYLLARSKEEIDIAVEELKRADPADVKNIRSLQFDIRRNESIEQWLKDVIQTAIDARDLIEGIE